MDICKKWFRLLALMGLITLTLPLAVGVSTAYGDGGDDQLSVPEKTELKYPNLGSTLDRMVARVEYEGATSEEAAGEALVHQAESAAVTIYLSGNVAGVVSFLEDNGGDPRNIGEDYIEAYVPVTLLGPVSERPGVLRVREIVPPEPTYGNFISQGVQTHGSVAWNAVGHSGQGIKVGVIDIGFEGFASLMGMELPTTVRARCYTEVGVFTSNLAHCGNNDKHGTAVAENIMDIAPDVSLYIATSNGSSGDFRNTVNWMISEGVSVINRSLGGSFEGPGDGTSPIPYSVLNTIDRAVEGGIIFLNAAGNTAKDTWFQDGSHSIYDSDGDGDGFIEFAEGDITNSMGYRVVAGVPGSRLPEGHKIWAYLRWEDTWPGASTDLDLYLVDSASGEIVYRAEDYQLGGAGDYPTESLSTVIPRDGEYHIQVVYLSGNLPGWIQLTVPKADSLEHSTERYSINGPSESRNPGMLAVGAAHYYDTNTIADYSSRGPTPDGRVKPDIVGTACGQAVSYEPQVKDGSWCWFPGTSSASPHVAGMAALVRQRFPSYTPAQVANYLKENAEQRETPDPNHTWGHGFAQLPSSQVPETLKEEERAALVALYNATGGPNWTNKANWASSQPVGSWHGVTTDPSGRVVGLSLPENGLAGEIASELGSLANLKWLNLNENELRGEIPPELGDLSGLTGLWLHENQLTGEIPAQLGDLANLTVLSLWGNELTGEIPAQLGDLANLTELDLSGNELSGEIPAQLGDLANLTVLWLHENQLTREIPEELGSLTKLETLSLSSNQLTGEIPAQLGDLANLTELDLSGNELSGEIPAQLGGLANLTELSLWDNELTGEIPAQLGGLANLTELSLWDNELSGEIPAQLGDLAKLTVLWLHENQLTREIPEELGSLTKLETLSLSSNQLTGEIPAQLGDLANLTELYLWGNDLSGEIPEELGSLTKLEILSLSSNQLTGPVPTWLGSLTKLEGLRLTRNQLTGMIPSELENLTSLSILNLGGNQLTGEIPAQLGDLANLTVLWLHENQLTGEIPAQLGDLANLTGLSLWGNDLSGEIPEELGSLTKLETLSLSSNQLTGEIPAQLGDLANLTGLSLWGNDLSGEIPEELGSLTKLEGLRLTRNQLTGMIPSELENLTSLSILNLGGNQLTGEIPAQLGDLANLTELALWDNELSGEIPAQLGDLANLTELGLSGNELSGEIPEELGSLTKLEILSLSSNQLTGPVPTWLGSLTKLKRLHLTRNQLTGMIPSELENLTSLSILALGGNQLTGEIPAQLGDLANLTELHIQKNQLTGSLPDHLTRMTALTEFFFFNNPGLCAPVDNAFQEWLESIGNNIGSSCAFLDSPEDTAVLVDLHQKAGGAGWRNSANWLSDRPVREWYGVVNDANGRVTHLFLGDNHLTGEIPMELGNLARLEVLSLFKNRLTGEIPAQLGNLTNLRILSLKDNQLTGDIPPELGSLASLEVLWLFNNRLTGEIPSELGNLANLADLRLEGNQLSGAIPAELGRLANLVGLYLSGNQLTGCVPASLRGLADNDFVQLMLAFCTTYDSDNDGVISISELFDAIDDYFGGDISISQLFDVIDLYFAGGTPAPASAPDLVVDMPTVSDDSPDALRTERHGAQPGQQPVGLHDPELLPLT